ncbi:MAG: hypothetical protein O2909_02330, partial [Chloroflexi bacterium]|nr:hypothetical protein [Chloroflexota bacterium]
MVEQPREVEQEHANTGNCYWHPETETGLSCSQCRKWVCTSCMVQAPVGIRCKECGRAVRMPTYDVRPTYYARAVGVTVAVAIGGGIIWGILSLVLLGVPFVTSLIELGVGYGAGELISLSVNRKRSMGLAWLAGGSVIGAFLIGRLTLFTLLGIPIGFGMRWTPLLGQRKGQVKIVSRWKV